MILNSSANVKNGSTLVTHTAGDTWEPINRPAFLRVAGFADLFMIAEIDQTDGAWLQLCRPYTRPTQTNVGVQITMDFTPELNLPVGNIGDVDMADLYNRAMLLLDRAPQFVPLHGPTHVGLGLDPVPLASTTDSGLLGKLSGVATDYVGGDNICHGLAGVPTGTMVAYGGSSLPAGWLWCNGTVQPISVYSALHAIIGTMYGAGTDNGLTTFNVPDCRGRALIGAGAGPGLQNYALSGKYGEELHVLSQAELAAHGHGVAQNPHTHPITDPGHYHHVYTQHYAWAQAGTSAGVGATWGASTGGWEGGTTVLGTTGINITTGDYAQISIASTGSNAGHNTLQPSLAVNVMIKT